MLKTAGKANISGSHAAKGNRKGFYKYIKGKRKYWRVKTK